MKTSITLINLRMDLLTTVTNDYTSRGGKLNGNIKANILKYVYDMLKPAFITQQV